MASTWIKILSSLPDNPDIVRIVDFLDRRGPDRGSIPVCCESWMEERNIQRNAVLGGLCRVWIWANQHAKKYPSAHKIEGCLVEIDHVAGIEGFGEAMMHVGWVDEMTDEQSGVHAIIFNDFDRHNVTECDRAGKSTSADRMRRKRKKDKELAGQEEDSPSLPTPVASPSPSPVPSCDSNVTHIPSYSSSSSGSSEGGVGGEERQWTHWARFVLNAYPKGKLGPRGSAMKAACRFLEKVSLRHTNIDGKLDIDAIVQNAVGLVGRFAKAVGDTQYIPHLKTWVDDGWWEMDPEEWETYGRNPKDLAKQNAQKRASETTSRAIEDRVAQSRENEEERQAASEAVERAKAAYRAMTPEERGAAVGRVREKFPMVTIPDPLPEDPSGNLARAVARVTG